MAQKCRFVEARDAVGLLCVHQLHRCSDRRRRRSADTAGASGQHRHRERQQVLCVHFVYHIIYMIILSRQARDKHRDNSTRRASFSLGGVGRSRLAPGRAEPVGQVHELRGGHAHPVPHPRARPDDGAAHVSSRRSERYLSDSGRPCGAKIQRLLSPTIL